MALDYQKLGRNIRAARQKSGLKQAELAERVEVTAQHICHIEMAKSQPSLLVLVAIANVLDTDLNSLLGDELQNSASKEILIRELSKVIDGASPYQLKLCINACSAIIQTEMPK